MAIDATVAGASANSYITVADADAYATDDTADPEVDAWVAASAEEKESALRRAAIEVDQALRSGWTKYVSTQRRRFPRSIDHAGTPAVPFIPEDLRYGTYKQAIYVHKNMDVLSRARTRRARGMQSASEPNVSHTEATDGESNIISPVALFYLEAYRLARGPQAVRTVRMAAGFIAS